MPFSWLNLIALCLTWVKILYFSRILALFLFEGWEHRNTSVTFFIIFFRKKLDSLIDDIADISWLYCTNPGHNFTRNRKLDFATTMKLIIAMEGGISRN